MLRDLAYRIAAAALGTLAGLAILSSSGCAGHRVELRPPSGGLVLTEDGLSVCYDAGLTVETVAVVEGRRLVLRGDGTIRLCGVAPEVAPSP